MSINDNPFVESIKGLLNEFGTQHYETSGAVEQAIERAAERANVTVTVMRAGTLEFIKADKVSVPKVVSDTLTQILVS